MASINPIEIIIINLFIFLRSRYDLFIRLEKISCKLYYNCRKVSEILPKQECFASPSGIYFPNSRFIFLMCHLSKQDYHAS